MSELNPFTPTFGKVPPFAAGRDNVLADMAYAFDNGSGDPNLPKRRPNHPDPSLMYHRK